MGTYFLVLILPFVTGEQRIVFKEKPFNSRLDCDWEVAMQERQQHPPWMQFTCEPAGEYV